jgi:hypothetical protein
MRSPAQAMGSCVQAVEGAGGADIHVQRRGRGSDRAELSILRRDANLDFREVNLGLGDNVKVVGEDIQRDMRDDLTDFSLGETRVPRCLNIRVRDVTPLVDHRAGEFERRIGFRIA